MLHVALYQPVIPPNTGNIARQCVGMGAALHLIGPLSMDLSARAVRRAGLDYWEDVHLTVHPTPADFLDWLDSRGGVSEGGTSGGQTSIGPEGISGGISGGIPWEPWLITVGGTIRYDQAAYADGDVLVLGNENTGLPAEWHERWPERRVYIPMLGPVRSYNLANAAAIVLAQACLRVGRFDRG